MHSMAFFVTKKSFQPKEFQKITKRGLHQNQLTSLKIETAHTNLSYFFLSGCRKWLQMQPK